MAVPIRDIDSPLTMVLLSEMLVESIRRTGCKPLVIKLSQDLYRELWISLDLLDKAQMPIEAGRISLTLDGIEIICRHGMHDNYEEVK